MVEWCAIAMLKIILLWQGFYGRNKHCWACRGPEIPARIRESKCILQAVLCGEGKGYVTHILLKCMLTLPRKKDSKWNIELVKVCEIMKLLRVAHVTQLKKLLKQQHQSVNSAAPNHFTVLAALRLKLPLIKLPSNPVMGRLSFPQTEILFICAKINA